MNEQVKYLAVVAFTAATFGLLAVFVQANHFSVCTPGCNTTVVWWNDTVNVTGSGSAGAAVTVRVDGTTACQTNTGAGGWNCTFLAPHEVGSYNLSVTVGSATDDSVLIVRPKYGEKPTGTASKFVLEIPSVMQEPSGRINNVLTRLTISRGPPL